MITSIQTSGMKHIVKIIILLITLVWGVPGSVLADNIPSGNILKRVLPNESVGTITIGTIEERKVNVTISLLNNNYTITEQLITVEKMVDPTSVSQARRRVPSFADLIPIQNFQNNANGTFSFYFIVPDGYDGAYVTAEFVEKSADDYTLITSLSDITNLSGKYRLAADIVASDGILGEFTGQLDGNFHKIYGLSKPLFQSTNGAHVFNLMLENVNVSDIDGGDGNVGAITKKAEGETRIYNCGILSGSVSGTGKVGGLVGLLNGKARVINCFSYADVSGGSDMGGIVGYNSVATTANDVNDGNGTMVMNCMFYGNITSGGNISPVYGGLCIDNLKTTTSTGLNTFNFYRYESPYSKSKNITAGKYNCALAVEEEYLTRIEIYRQLLNSNRKLAAWYVFGSPADANTKMAKWVLETADGSITDPKPYPVLKPQGFYHSIVNYDAAHAPETSENQKSLTINVGSGSLRITGKDPDHFNYNYHKVQLPYYDGNDNYKKVGDYHKVVTGWEVSFTGSTSFGTTSYDSPNYNLADRKAVNGRVYSQGAYLDVPEGVSEITLTPHWANAVFVSDANLDKVYSKKYCLGESDNALKTPANVTYQQFDTDGKTTTINGIEMTVYTNIGTAISKLAGKTNPTVYDYAVVLVGNLHLTATPSNGTKPFTVMSADFDQDHEPDFSLIYTHPERNSGAVSPIRFDFLNMPGFAMAQKPNGASNLRNVSIFKPSGWFEVTNTCLLHMVQFEYDNGNKSAAPVILLGGKYDQFVSTQSSTLYNSSKVPNTTYIYVGGNAWFKEFGNGTHSDGWQFTPHVPVSVSGGYFEKFYLSGTYRPDAKTEPDNAECYVSGGMFGEMAGAGQQQIDGNVNWFIDYADIDEFYGGGINGGKPITGNINTVINKSNVKFFCGGPKFGDMQKKGSTTITWGLNKEGSSTASRVKQIDADREVTTNATGCTFGNFYGAGYGGNSYYRVRTKDTSSGIDWSSWQSDYTGKKGKYIDNNNGIATDFDYEYFIGSNGAIWGRFYVQYAAFSMAQTNNVTSTLDNCTITGDFYGGGCRGKVDGKASSTLIDCTVTGNVFGGGYSASVPTIDVRSGGFDGTNNIPSFNPDAGVFNKGVPTEASPYTWTKGTLTDGSSALSGTNIITDIDLSSLGQVKETDLKVQGKTTVNGLINGSPTGGVFGGGDASAVYESTKVTISPGETNTEDKPTIPNVFGGGNKAGVYQNTVVELEDGTITNDVYGGCNTVGTIGGNTSLQLTGGTIGGSVFGGGKGQPTLVNGHVTVNVGKVVGESKVGSTIITGDVYGGSALGNVNAKTDEQGTLTHSGNDNESNPIATKVNLIGGTVNGSVYGGGFGQVADANNNVAAIAANVYGPVTVTTTGGKAQNVFGCNNLYGAPQQTVAVNINGSDAATTEIPNPIGNVYGGGNQAAYAGSPTVTMTGGTVNNVFGGGLSADVGGSVIVNIQGGTVTNDVYGGGALANSNTNNTGDPTVNTTTVNLLGGEIHGDAYGGGLGRKAGTGVTAVEAKVYGDIKVYLGGNATAASASATAFNISYKKDDGNNDVVSSGRVFGCNNLNGSPEGNVTVTVWKTVKGNTDKTPSGDLYSPIESKHKYRLAAVYGGGNLANYTATGKKAHVIIRGCDDTSILTVYGGGNAAAVPETNVEIYEAYEIGSVFGGGNGKDKYTLDDGTTWIGNSGANVNGNASTVLYGGLIHEAFGGSNEKGRITGNVAINTNPQGTCTLDVGTIYGAGKNADIEGDLIVALGCMPADKKTDAVYGGAENANVKGNVELTITSGNFGKVFGGNNTSGAIFGSIKLNIMESGCSPINIDELYGGGYDAAYSVYGYYVKTEETAAVNGTGVGNPANETPILTNDKLTFLPRESASDTHLPVNKFSYNESTEKWEWTVYQISGENAFTPYADPVVNIVSATSIGKVFGGGLGESAKVYGNPTVNINQAYPLQFESYNAETGVTTYSEKTGAASAALGQIGGGYNYNNESNETIHDDGGVYGGGNQAAVYGNTTVNIGTATAVDWKVLVLDAAQQPILDTDGKFKTQTLTGQTYNTVRGANITGNVYGGGNLADVTGYTQVNICAKETGTGANKTWTSVPEGDKKVTIAGNVYGGGKGVASESGERAFFCEEAMVGEDNKNSKGNNDDPAYANYGTHVRIGNGTVNGSVYGGGEIGRVEFHTEVVVGIGGGTEGSTKSPVITGSVFGAGKGANTHGYSGLVRGDSRVTVQGDAKIGHSVYGGGEMASVGKYQIDSYGLPTTPLWGGKCTVTIQGYAEIGPDGMKMDNSATTGKPDDTGHVFGAGKGTLPYENVTGIPWSMELSGKVIYDETHYVVGTDGLNYEAAYYKFIQSLGLASNTEVTIGEHAFVKGSVYGGSENGYLQADAHVTIAGGQIGAGLGQTAPYVDIVFIDPTTTPVTTENALATCATWTYDKATTGKPYDKYATYLNSTDNEYYYDLGYTKSSAGGAPVATDGHTYYGNVFGGGRGVVPFAAGKWHRAAGSVAGNTRVDITGGHILSSVYGGNENTDVGSYAMGTNGEPTTTLNSGGTCTINMSGGTVGVPRTKEQIDNNPVIGNVFGAGKGDKRVLFNTWTNVGATSVNISGTARIYGSVFGGGEDGHVIGNAVTNIGGTVTIGETQHTHSNVVIGSTGISGADGNVFGGGRGSVTALTAGVVGGNVTLTIDNGKILGSVYGGGRLASVGTNFVNPENTSLYGALQSPDADHGNITVYINDGTIGQSNSTGVNGNIFGGSKGTESDFRLGIVRSTTINMTGGTAYASVYGGGELAQVVGSHTTDNKALGTEIYISGGTIGISGQGGATWGNVFAGGKGNTSDVEAGLVKSNTKVAISQASGKTTKIWHNIYGGGAYGSVGTFTYYGESTEYATEYDKYKVGGTAPDAEKLAALVAKKDDITGWTSGGTAYVTISGGTIGNDGKENGMIFGSSRGDVGASGEIHDKLAWVYDTEVTINGGQINGSVYGGGENGHTYHNATVAIHDGTIGINANETVTYKDDPKDATKVTYTGKDYNYPYRGNVFGGGCGTDKYYSNTTGVADPHDGNGDKYNPLAGIVLGAASITMDGGTVVHNIYGAGAMGSVGTMTTDADNHLVISGGGTTTIAISGGTVGVDGIVVADGNSNGNVFGAARGDVDTDQTDVALVKTTGVTISGSAKIKGNVYGGGALGDVGTYYTITEAGNNKGNNVYLGGDTSGTCVVTVTGGTIGSEGNTTAGHVFGAGKGDATTYTCQKAMVKGTTVTVSNGTIYGNVYGGGEVGRVEHDAVVTIGEGAGAETGGTSNPEIKGSVFGAGAGLETHGYSALVRGNSTVTVQGNAKVRKNVYGGGEVATVGKYWVSVVAEDPDPNNRPPQGFPSGMPYATRDGGLCTVTIQGYATVGPDAVADVSNAAGHVFGAGKGVEPHYVASGTGQSQRMNSDGDWEPFATEAAYLQFIETLALASNTNVTVGANATVKGSVYGGSESGFVQDHTIVTINEGEIGTAGTYTYNNIGNIFGGGRGISGNPTAGRVGRYVTLTVNDGIAHGSVFGGGEMGVVKEDVTVNINGGTIDKDVYGGGALAHTQTGNWDTTNNTWLADKIGADGKTAYKTTVNLTGGLIKGDAYGGGLGQLGTNPIAAQVYGDVFVTLGDAAATKATAFNIDYYDDDTTTTDDESLIVNSGRVFGCNNLNGSPKGSVLVTVNKTVAGNKQRTAEDPNNTGRPPMGENASSNRSYEVAAVYGGGNLANYIAEGEVSSGVKRMPKVLLNTCDISIEEVYGGGNAAEVPQTDVLILGAYEIENVFGGGNGEDKYLLDGTWHTNLGANVNGNANTLMKGGYIHQAYGASNSKGNISGTVTIDKSPGGMSGCPVQVDKMVAAGNNADVNGDVKVFVGCQGPDITPLVFYGADNANVNGNVEVTITSGHFGKVFAGNNIGGAIRGRIILNIEETSNCEPIRIEELYLGGNRAAYSKFGYYIKTTETEAGTGYGLSNEHAVLTTDGRLWFMPRESEDDPRLPVDTYDGEAKTWTTKAIDAFTPYADPVLNVISCTSIGEVFGGGYGVGGDMYANPTVNINMIPGKHASEIAREGTSTPAAHRLGAIGNVYGGGNQAAVVGNATINIGTASEVTVKSKTYNSETEQYTAGPANVEGAYITGNVYGGGKLANIAGNTYVNICAVKDDDGTTTDVIEYKGVTISGTDYEGVTIKGDVFGGGKGVTEAAGVTGAFECAKAMVGVVDSNDGKTDIMKESIDKGTRVSIGNGTVEGSVYGGGEIGRVEWNGVVTIGLPVGTGETSAPEIKRDVFGGGKGVEQYGYAALMRGNTFVTVQGNAKVGKSVYGGGEIASVGKYKVATQDDINNSTFMAAHPGIEKGMPYSLGNEKSGYCNVIVRGNAEIGPDNMKMYYANGDAPDDDGHVFGAGKGVLPYENEDDFNCQASGHAGQKHPGRMSKGDAWECYNNQETKYLRFIETQALATHTEVLVDGNAFVKGSVYGGSLSGHVQHDTHVTITGDCQIGAGDGINERYTTHYNVTKWPTDIQTLETSWAECAHWTMDVNNIMPYDPYAKHYNSEDGKYYYGTTFTDPNNNSYGGSSVATDGHTYYGNVFGGGSGVVPYKPGKWHREAGTVGGNTVVDITGGHILTSVYGGNECTDVGTYDPSNRALLAGTGKCTINMTGGTVGVPRTKEDIAAHPMTCCVYGGGKGDQRVSFNKWTNVGETEVNISGTARIYGSTFGGGEDGHVLGDVETNIGGTVTIANDIHSPYSYSNVIIGSQGRSGADGNVFGGGRGFSEDALTAGVVCGNVTLNIHNGKVLGSVYGGGRLASVGTHLAGSEHANYGTLIPNGKNQVIDSNDVTAEGATHGHIAINIDGGIIGATDSDGKLQTSSSSIGDVFGGCRGAGSDKRFGLAKKTTVTMTAGTVNGNVYGGGELGYVGEATYNETTKLYEWKEESAGGGLCTIGISGTSSVVGNVFGAGKGLADDFDCEKALVRTTSVNVSAGTVGGNVYGGGEVGRVDQNTVVTIGNGDGTNGGTAAPTITGNVFGAGAGVETHGYSALVRGNATVTVQGNANVGHNVYGGGMIASVGQYGLDSNFMPETLKGGGDCRVTVKGYAVIGSSGEGHVFGAGKGVNPFDASHNYIDYITNSTDKATKPKRMTKKPDPDKMPALYDPVGDGSKYIWEYYTSQDNYFKFLQTLALATDSYATIDGNASVHGNVYGGSESGFVQRETDVNIQGSSKILTVTDTNTNTTTDGNVFGGGRGVSGFDKAGRVRGNAKTTISGSSTVNGNVYGGGELGFVGKFSANGRNYDWQKIKNQQDKEEETGTCTVIINSATAEVKGDVFGAGKGEAITFKCEPAMTRTTSVSISNGTVGGNVYGGGEVGRVDENTVVTIGADTGDSAPHITGSVFGAGAGLGTHGYSALVRGNTTVTIQNHATVGHSVYGGGEIASVGKYGLDDQKMPSVLLGGGYCYVKVKGDAEITGDVFGAGQGIIPNFDKDNADRAKRPRRMTMYSSTDFPDAAKISAETGTASGTTTAGTTWEYYEPGSPYIWEYFREESGYLTYLETLALATHPEVTIEGNASIGNDVYGGGERGITKGSVIVNINGGTITRDVYGGGALANTNTTSTVGEEDHDTGVITTTTVAPKTTVNLHGGTIGHDVYGGGLGRLEVGTVGQTGYVSPVEAKVYGDVLVKLNETTTSDNCKVKGTVFGCNNLNGSPQSAVTVHVYKTEGYDDDHTKDPAKGNSKFDLKAVYGGGNLAAFIPDVEAVADTAVVRVIIDGCNLTSIGTVYGGGNAASVPATDVVVNGTHEIGDVFGGGNGKDNVSYDGGVTELPNPGANVGYLNYSEYYQDQEGDVMKVRDKAAYDTDEERKNATDIIYGSGMAHATIYGGVVHKVYGGSNTRGNVRVESRTTLEDSGCDYSVGESYGGGNNALQDGDAILEVGCISGLEIAYGGASDADVNGDVILNLTNGRYGRVFGGNNLGGAIRGSIIVNIEETGCNPIVIGELYCGGNKAAYSVYGYEIDGNGKPQPLTSLPSGGTKQPDPVLNVKSFTSIGKIFGGGYGEEAKMVANPTVNINVVKGRYSNRVIAEGEKVYGRYDIPSHKAGDIGAIGSVFGGGNAAEVIGTPHVNIGTKVGEVIPLVSKPIEDSEGKAPSADDWTPSYQLVTVEGVDIRDNVYGAGNNAPVTGDTEVVIGKNNDVKTYSFTSYSEGGTAWSSGLAQTTGKTKNGLAEVEILTNGKYGDFVGKKYYVAPNATADGIEKTELKDEDGNSLTPKLYVSIKPFVYKTYSFTSYGAASEGTQYSTGTAAPTGNFKTFNGTDYMQIVVLTNPNYVSWEGKTFYVPVNAVTNGNARTQLRKANGDPEAVWVSISEANN